MGWASVLKTTLCRSSVDLGAYSKYRYFSVSARKKLSYMEAREYAGIEQRIADAEQQVQAHRAELEDPANATDAARLLSAQAALEAAQQELDALYHRWSELEEKKG